MKEKRKQFKSFIRIELLEIELESFDKIESENPTNNNVWRTNQLYSAYMKIKNLKDESNKEDKKMITNINKLNDVKGLKGYSAARIMQSKQGNKYFIYNKKVVAMLTTRNRLELTIDTILNPNDTAIKALMRWLEGVKYWIKEDQKQVLDSLTVKQLELI